MLWPLFFSEFIYRSSYRHIFFFIFVMFTFTKLCFRKHLLFSWYLSHKQSLHCLTVMNFGQGHCFYLLRGQYFYFQFWCREFGYVWELQYAESVAGHRGHGSQLPRFLGAGRVLSAEERLGASNHAGSHPHQRHGTGRSRLHLLILTCLSTCTLSPVREM